MSKKIFNLSLVVCFFLSACAPGLNSTLRVSNIPVSENAPRSLTGLRVKVEDFQDSRPTLNIARIKRRDLKPDGDVGLSVQQAVERQLKIQGARLALFGSPIIRGSVKEWHVAVQPKFPSSIANAKASIFVELFDTTGKKIYGGSYSGNMSVEHPVMPQDKVESILGEAMLNAINKFLNDTRVVDKLRNAIATSPGEKIEEPRDDTFEERRVSPPTDEFMRDSTAPIGGSRDSSIDY